MVTQLHVHTYINIHERHYAFIKVAPSQCGHTGQCGWTKTRQQSIYQT